nr:beta glucosidase [Cellulomonas gilvus]
MHRKNHAAAAARTALVAAIAAAFPLFTPGAFAAPEPAEPAQKPWLDASLDADQRARLAVQAMTQQEKLRWVFGYFGHDFGKSKKHPDALPQSAGYIPGTPRLGLPALFETDAGQGVASQSGANVRERTALPSGLSTASTWDPKVAYAGGAMIGSEARASGFNVMLAGGVNLQREPRNGRNFEYAGEDPLLAGTMIGQAIKGVESNRIISTLKHFVLNDQETGRNELDARIDKAALRMSDLLAMELALEQSDAGSVMCAYNRLNGPYTCEHPWLLSEVLKRDWGFRGYVMSDWGATHSTVAAANSGLDQQSGQEFDKSPYFGGALEEAVKTGAVPQKRLDDMVTRIVRTMFGKGVVDNPLKPGVAIDFAANGGQPPDGEEGMVLLKNEGRLLPLAKTVRTIAVIGGHADAGVLSGGGSSQVYPVGGIAVKGLLPATWPGPVVYYPSSPLRAIQAQAPNAKVVFDDGRDPARAARGRWGRRRPGLRQPVDRRGQRRPDARAAGRPGRADHVGGGRQRAHRGRAADRRTGHHALAGARSGRAGSLVSGHQRRRGDRECAVWRGQSVRPPAGHLPAIRAATAAPETRWRSEEPRAAVRRRLPRRCGGRLQVVRPEGPQAAVPVRARPVLHNLRVLRSVRPAQGWPPARALQGDQHRQRGRQGRAAGVRRADVHQMGGAEAPGRLEQGRPAAGRDQGSRGRGGAARAGHVRREVAHLAPSERQDPLDAGRRRLRRQRHQRDRRAACQHAGRTRPRTLTPGETHATTHPLGRLAGASGARPGRGSATPATGQPVPGPHGAATPGGRRVGSPVARELITVSGFGGSGRPAPTRPDASLSPCRACPRDGPIPSRSRAAAASR